MFGTPGSVMIRAVRRRRPGGAPHVASPAPAASAVTMARVQRSPRTPASSPGTVVDDTSQVVPGATVTLTNEPTADARTTVSSERGEFAFRAVHAGSYTVRVELAGFRTIEQRNNVLNASGQLDLGIVQARCRHPDRGGVGRRRRQHDRDEEQRLLGAADREADRADPEPGPRRRQPAAAAARRALRERYRGDGRQLRIADPEHRRPAQELESGDRRRPERQRALGHQPDELVDQSRCDRRGQGAAEHLQGGVRSHAAAPTSRSSARAAAPTITAARYWYGKRDAWNATPWENNRAGVAKPKLHIDTPGFNLGGPVKIPGVYDQGADKKLFFFYSFEAPQVQKPGPLRLYRMPTALERQGNFSQTFDTNGRLIFIKDPPPRCACSATAGGAGCFPGNIIPANRLDPQRARAAEPAAAAECASAQSPNYNFTRQETSDNPRFNNLAAGRQRGRRAATRSGRRCGTFIVEPVRVGDHGRPGEVGLLRRVLRLRRQRRSTAAGTTSSSSNRRQRVPGRHPARDRRLRHQGRRRPGRASCKSTVGYTLRAVPSGAEHARRHPAVDVRPRRRPASTARTSPTTAASDRPRTTGWRACATT